MSELKEVIIGYVAVDSGQIMICDPGNIDDKWADEPFKDVRRYAIAIDSRVLAYPKDFNNYNDPIPDYGMSMNDLLSNGQASKLPRDKAKEQFSYNAVANITLREPNHGAIPFSWGNPGLAVAFASGYGDGLYPVTGFVNEEGRIMKVVIDMS